MNKRFLTDISYHQFAIIPSFGITYGLKCWKFGIAFVWLNFRFRIGFMKKERSVENEND